MMQGRKLYHADLPNNAVKVLGVKWRLMRGTGDRPSDGHIERDRSCVRPGRASQSDHYP